MICDPWSISVVLFPLSDLPIAKPRPALVLSTREFNDQTGQTLLAMITTTQKAQWPTDVVIRDLCHWLEEAEPHSSETEYGQQYIDSQGHGRTRCG
jgi:phage-related protein